MRFVGLEEDRALSVLFHAKNLAVISCGDVQTALRVKLHVPDVLGFWIEESLRRKLPCRGGAARLARNSIHLAVRRRGRINGPILSQRNRLHLQFLGLKDHGRSAIGRYAINPCWRARSSVNNAIFVRGNAPDKGRW